MKKSPKNGNVLRAYRAFIPEIFRNAPETPLRSTADFGGTGGGAVLSES